MKHYVYIKSAPRFFRLIGLAMFCSVASLALLAALIPAPLQEPANLALVPNPVKAAWFLLWIQEVVSWSKYLIYAALAAVLWLVSLPWLIRQPITEHASWWPREQMVNNLLFSSVVGAILFLTILAFWFRGANWGFVLP